MRKMLFLFLAILAINCPCHATDHPEDLLSMINLVPGTATQASVTAMFGTPVKVEDSKKRTFWYYTHGNTNMVLSWSKKSDNLERFSFKCEQAEHAILNSEMYRKLKSGATDIAQAIKILGIPKDMTIKEVTQEMHYAYQKNVLRLFFRDRVLVDFTLLSQK